MVASNERSLGQPVGAAGGRCRTLAPGRRAGSARPRRSARVAFVSLDGRPMKNVPFNVALLLTGAAFILLSATGGVTVSGYSVSVGTLGPRIALTLAGLFFIVTALTREQLLSTRPFRRHAKRAPEPAAPDLPRSAAAQFLYTLDEVPSESFPFLVQTATRLSVLGRTTVNLITQYEKVFEQLAKAGCEVRILFVNPDSEASQFTYGGNTDVYRHNIVSAAQHLKRLQPIMGRHLNVRVTNHVPTLSIMIVERANVVESMIRVQLYFLHSAIGRDRPIFRITYEDKWYAIFRDEFEEVWANALEWDIASVQV